MKHSSIGQPQNVLRYMQRPANEASLIFLLWRFFYSLSVWITSSNKLQFRKFRINRSSIDSSIHHDFFNKINRVSCIGFVEEQYCVNVNFRITGSQFFRVFHFLFNFRIGCSTMYLYTIQNILSVIDKNTTSFKDCDHSQCFSDAESEE